MMIKDIPTSDCPEGHLAVGVASVRTWPAWLTRGAAVLGLAATAALAVASANSAAPVPRAQDSAPTEQAATQRSVAALASRYASRIEGELWDHGRFSYEAALVPAPLVVGPAGPAWWGGKAAWNWYSCTQPAPELRFGAVYWC